MQNLLKSIYVIAITAFGLLFSTASFAKEVKQVGIIAIVDHPSLNEIRDGVIDELIAQGYQPNQDIIIKYQSAQGSSANAAQIAKQFIGNKVDAIVTIATQTAQAAAASTKTIPVIFAGITDPIAAKLIKSFEPTATNITGVSDYLPPEPQVEFMKKIVPHVKSVGYIYTPSEVNSTIVLKQLQTTLAQQNIKVIAVPAQRTADIPTAVKSLKNKVDLIYTTTDNSVVSAYESLVKFANENKIPLLASFPDAIERGAVAAFGMNYYDVGRQSGKIVTRVLQGEKPGEIAPELAQDTHIVLNLSAAKIQNVALSTAVIESAYNIIE